MAKAKREAISRVSTKSDTSMQLYRKALEWSVATLPEDRLRWVLEFAAEDLDALSSEERAERAVRLEWCGMHGSASHMPDTDTFPMPDAVLRRLHVEIKEGLRVVLGDQRNEEWYVPGPARMAFYRASPRFKKGPKDAETAPKRTRFTIRWDWGNAEGWVLGGIVHLLQEAGSRLRGCKTCGRAFLAVKRQIYCGDECSQKARDHRKQEKAAE
jgi:hypothetical protein